MNNAMRVSGLGLIALSVLLAGCGEDPSRLSPEDPGFMRAEYTGAVARHFEGDNTHFYSYRMPDIGVVGFQMSSTERGDAWVWIQRVGTQGAPDVGTYPLEGFNTWDPEARGVTVTIMEDGFMWRSLDGRLDIDSVTDMVITGGFRATAAAYCPAGVHCLYDADSIDSSTPRMEVEATFQITRDTTHPMLFGG
jgi:hypothetical protein